MLVDFSGVTADSLDPKSIAADCDFVKGIVTKFPDQVRQMLQEMRRGSAEGVGAGGERIAAEIGFAGSRAVGRRQLLLSDPSAESSLLSRQAARGALKQKATSPAATTTPKPQ